ncbi:transcriptional regulator, TetR family [Lentzea xinjiangensis]|uniref:Transcriptional regulator, TetR family n=1 Tax=Lentzea xinjiangensis TaxID=402600 RepID=A0A1H9V664_9PSEU|nr:TetR/AcrR family transcriptional regulator [Lentzea xinjiangensis]SES16727.1 transcriptional regulator, TetR family [Lentzea xinjiangensis]
MDASFRRARQPEQKEQRREAILAAARDLALDAGVAGVSLGDIAKAVGLVKSNVLRYFGTREEIYLQLTMRGGTEWADAVCDRLAAVSGIDGMAAALADSFAERPLYCDLVSHAETMLEHNVSIEVLHTSKLWAIGMYARVGDRIVAACPELTGSQGAAVVFAAGAFVGRLHPITRPPAALAELYAREPAIAAVFPSFRPALHRFIAATAAGLREVGDEPPRQPDPPS